VSIEDLQARVIASHGRTLLLRLADGQEAPARPARRGLSPVCGDRVSCQYDSRHRELRVFGCEPRATALHRANARGQSELIAANVSLLLAVIAPVPEPDLFVVDRYLASAECGGMAAAVLMNKAELSFDDAIRAELDALRAVGHRCLPVSAQTGLGLGELRALLRGQTSMLVGQSGVGKSSLLRALLPECDAAVGELVRAEEGRHTTSTARLYSLPDGGEIIDAPGVRDFAPALEYLDARSLGFPEVARLAPACRFGDCRHMHEPDCAVRAAVGVTLSPRRYESYRRLRRLYEALQAPQAQRRPRRRSG
jgi:ribosome biogenesis GTPase